MYLYVYTYIGDIVGSIPDHRNKVSIGIKKVIILLLAEVLASDL